MLLHTAGTGSRPRRASIFAIADAYPFSAVRSRCLARCRTTLSFVIELWQGRRERVKALRMGWRHGAYGVGGCWSMMLLMFVVGSGNVGWMLLLGAIMAAERNVSRDHRLRRPLGLGLIAVAGSGVWSL